MTPVTFEFPSCCCQSSLWGGPKNKRLAPANSPTYISKPPMLNSARHKFLSPNPSLMSTKHTIYVHKITHLHLLISP